MISRRLLPFCFLIVFASGNVQSQDQNLADSLKAIYVVQDFDEVDIYRILREIAFNESNPEEAAYFANELIDLAAQNDSVLWLHRGYIQLGNTERLKGNYDKAFESYFKGLEYAQEAGYPSGIGTSYSVIADTYSLLDDSENAMSFYRQGINVLREAQDSTFLASALLNAGDELVNQGRYDSALIYFYESGAIFTAQNYVVGKAYTLGNMGMVYALQGSNELAESHFKESMSILEDLGEYYALAFYLSYMVDIYIDKKDLDRALEYGNQMYTIAGDRGLKEEIKVSSEKLATVYELLGDHTQAYKYLKSYVSYRDSINVESAIQKVAEERRAFEVAQKQLEVDVLNQQKRNQQIIGVGLVLIVVLSVILSMTLYRNSQRRKKLNAELRMINETKDKFFSIISHDLRGPISAFYGISRIIKSYIENRKYEQLGAMTDEIDESISSISTLLDNLLSWAVQQQGDFPYHPAIMNLHDMGDDLKHVFKSNATAKNISIENNIPNQTYALVDKNSTTTIFRNLVGNAIKFTPEGGRITLEGQLSNEGVIISVEDTGVGIPEEDLQVLFELNEKKSSYGTSGEKGLGLGLQLVFEFTQLNRGTINVESEIGKGTRFSVSLPNK